LFYIFLVGQSLYYSFAQLSNQGLVSTSSSEVYSTLCKISATRVLLNNQTRSIDLTSQQYGFYNQLINSFFINQKFVFVFVLDLKLLFIILIIQFFQQFHQIFSFNNQQLHNMQLYVVLLAVHQQLLIHISLIYVVIIVQ
jgi:hypothetical protein